MNSNQKKKFIIGLAVFCLLLIIFFLVLIIFQKDKERDLSEEQTTTIFTPEFLSNEEKKSLDISVEDNIQVLRRDDNGKLKVYKIIKDNEAPINPVNINSLSPRAN